jgi:hypothetical protein
MKENVECERKFESTIRVELISSFSSSDEESDTNNIEFEMSNKKIKFS